MTETRNVPGLLSAVYFARENDKRYRHGTHRDRDPAETLARIQRLAPRAGVTRVADITGLDTIGLPVFMVARPNSRSLAVSQGKGLDSVSAAVSGLMEAIESYHAERIGLPLRLGSYRELRHELPMIDVERLPRTTASNYHPARPILWVEGLELGSDRSTWVPYELVHTNFSLPLPQGSGAFLMSSNGLASGNTRVEALSHAICEVIERDALTLFSVGGGLERTELRVRTETIDDPDCQRLLALLERAEVSCGIWDITSDVGIASFLCVIVDRAANSFRQLYAASGSGCHPAREIALLRAITEAAQCRLTFISGARDDADRDFFERARRPSHVAEVRRQIQAAPEGTRSYADIPTCHHGAFLDDVAWEVECLRAAGLTEIVAVDLTKPEFNVPVMRVVVPGLESLHNAPGFLPGARAREVLSGGRQ